MTSHQQKSPSICVIIPCLILTPENFNNTIKCFTLAKDNTSFDFETVIIESGKSSLLSGVADKYVYKPSHDSYAHNVNLGLVESKADYTVVLSNDVFVVQGWLEKLIETFTQYPNAGVVCLESSEYNNPAKDEVVEDYFGGVWCIKKECFEKVGLMDEGFKNSFEDADYWVRIYKAGYKVYKNRSVIVEHLVKNTTKYIKTDREDYIRNRIVFFEKHKDCGLPIFERLK